MFGFYGVQMFDLFSIFTVQDGTHEVKPTCQQR
jgi:hypothetical protein